MRITFLVSQLDNGGGCRVIAHYAQGLMQLGHTVLVVAPAPNRYGRLKNVLSILIPPLRRHPPNHFARLGIPIATLERYRPIKESDVRDADVIIATWWETAIWMKDFPASKGKKVHFVQGYELGVSPKHQMDFALTLPFPKITISNWLASILVGLNTERPIVIPNGVDADLFRSSLRNRPIKPTVGFVYTPDPLKGADIALKAIQIAQRNCPTLKVHVFGHPSPPSSFPTENITYSISPQQSKLKEIYGSCTAWLYPSIQEGFGLPILEAMSCGTPVIACPSGAAPEILAKGGGKLLTTFEPKEMAAAIVEYINMSDTEWKSVSKEARGTSKQHNWKSSVDMFEKYLSVC